METLFLMDRMRTIGASEIGQCARRMYYVKTEGQRDTDYDDRWGARVRGKIMEQKFWLPAVRRRFRKKLLIAGNQQTTVHDRYLSATPDGLVIEQPRDVLAEFGIPDIGPSCCFILECKSIDPRVNLTAEKHEHAMQTQVQLGLIRLLTPYKPEFALISYMDASFWDDVDEFVVTYDAEIYERMHVRAVKIKTASAATELQPEGWIAGGKECEHCPFATACGIVRRSLPETEAAADPQFVAEIKDLCIEHEQLALSLKSIEAEINEVKDDIKNRLREKSVRKIAGVLSWYPVKGRAGYDMDRFKAAAIEKGLDPTDYATEGNPSDALRVTFKGAPVA